jgi:hypothetical protein
MIGPILVERTYRTRSGEACKVVGIVGDLVLFVSDTQNVVEEMPHHLFSVCVVEEVALTKPRAGRIKVGSVVN